MDDRNHGAGGMSARLHGLAELQREFQRHIVGGDDAITDFVNQTEHVPVATRLSIYSQAYRSRLAEALASNIPRLQQLVGDEVFAQLAQLYVDEQPSKFASIRWFGEHFDAVIAREYASHPWLAELARWEWAIATAFDASDAAPLRLEALAEVAPYEWPDLRFEFHPSLQRLDLSTNAAALFKALSEELPLPEPVALDHPQSWLIWRQGLKTQYRSLSSDEAAALDAMRGGDSFQAMCTLLSQWHDEAAVPVNAAGMLKRWIVDELATSAISARCA
jgi:hypothetical protein